MAEIKVKKLNEQGEFSVFTYNNEFSSLANLVHCIMSDYYNMHNWWDHTYQKHAKRLTAQISKSKKLYIWCAKGENIGYCTLIEP